MGRAEDLFARISDLGEHAIDQFIIDRFSEELFLDFKRSADNGSGVRLCDRDRENLGRAISGFANSDGGVVVWGIDCRDNPDLGDVASAKIGIHDPRRFKSWLENAVSGLTIPPHSGVLHSVVEPAGGLSGFVATLVPRSVLGPHQCVRPRQYYMRVGSNFEPVPHGVLAGMFGRAPQPEIFHMWSAPPAEFRANGVAFFRVGLLLTNRSPVVARDVYVSLMVNPPGGNSRIEVEFPDTQNWAGNQAFGFITQLIAKDNFRLAPNVIVQPAILRVQLVPPFPNGLWLKITTGCTGSSIKEFTHRLSADELNAQYVEFVNQSGSEHVRREFVRQIIGAVTDNPEVATHERQ